MGTLYDSFETQTPSRKDMQRIGMDKTNTEQRKEFAQTLQQEPKGKLALAFEQEKSQPSDVDYIKQGLKAVPEIAEKIKAGTMPEFQPVSRIPGIIGQLPGGFGGLAREIPADISEQQYITRLRKIRKGKGTSEEKDIASKAVARAEIRNIWDRIQRAVQAPYDAAAFQKEAQELKGKFLKKTYRRWERGSAMVVGGGMHLAEELTKFATLGKYGETPGEYAKMYHDVLKQPEMVPVVENTVDKYFGGAVETAPFLGTALAPAALSGGATLPSSISGFLVAYGVEGNNAYQTARDRGLSERAARTRGVAVGLINGGIEVAGGSGGKYFKNKKAAIKAMTTKLGKAKIITRSVVKNALKEGLLEELPQEAVSMIVGGDIPRKKDGTIDYNATAERLTDSAIMGTILGGLVDAPISTVSTFKAGTAAAKQLEVEKRVRREFGGVGRTPPTEAAVAPQTPVETPKAAGPTITPEKPKKGTVARRELEAANAPITKVESEKLQDQGMSVKEIADTPPSELRARLLLSGETLEGTAQRPGDEPSGGVAWHTAITQALEKMPIIQRAVRRQQRATLKQRVGAAAGTLKGLRKPGKGVSGKEAIWRSTGKLRGKQAKYTQLYPRLDQVTSPEVVEAAYNDIADTDRIEYFDRIGLTNQQGTGAFDKLVAGTALTPGEVNLIKKWMPDIGTLAERRVPFSTRAWNTIIQIMNIPRSTLAGFADLSGIGRQQRALGMANIRKYVKAIHATHRSFFSAKYTDRMQDEYESSEFYDEAKEIAGVDFSAHAHEATDLSEQEEEYVAAPMLEKIPYLGHVFKATERAFVVPLNWLRMQVYEAARIGNPNMTESQMKVLGNAINDLSGRSSVGRANAAKKISVLMTAFFSPRFALSRIKLPYTMGRATYESVRSKELKKDVKALVTGETRGAFQVVGRSMALMIAGNLALMALLKMLWPEDVETDPDLRSSNGGKLKIGNKRIDLWSGYLQPAQLFVRLATGQRKSQAGRLYDVDIRDTLESFARSKTAPVVGLALDIWRGKTFYGEKLGAAPRGKVGEFLTEKGVPKSVQGISKEVWNRTAPLTAQDFGDAFVDAGIPSAVGMGALGFYGMGVQTYENWPAAKLQEARNQAAMEKHGKRWDDLKHIEQKRLKKEPALKDIEAQTIEERRKMGPGDYAKYIEKPLNDSAKRMQRQLPEKIQTELELLDMTPGGVKRTISRDFVLNDNRFNAYEKYAVENIEKLLKPRIEAASWKDREYLSRLKVAQEKITKAKANARKRVLREINQGKL